MARDKQWNPFFSLMKNMTVLGYLILKWEQLRQPTMIKFLGNMKIIPVNKYSGKVWAT